MDGNYPPQADRAYHRPSRMRRVFTTIDAVTQSKKAFERLWVVLNLTDHKYASTRERELLSHHLSRPTITTNLDDQRIPKSRAGRGRRAAPVFRQRAAGTGFRLSASRPGGESHSRDAGSSRCRYPVPDPASRTRVILRLVARMQDARGRSINAQPEEILIRPRRHRNRHRHRARSGTRIGDRVTPCLQVR